jgi:radical SAM-linked protein
LAIESDLRFLSHRDTVRAVERAAARAHLPVKYTQGFNPHPVLSLACPRPVGVASLADLAVMQLTRAMPAETLLGLLNGQSPGGMTFIRAEVLQAKAPPRVRRVDYDAPVDQARQANVADLAAKFNQADAWAVERGADRPAQGAPGPAKARRARTVDLKALVVGLRLEDGRLRFSLVSDGQIWARPGEVLEAVGLDGRTDLARLVRTDVLYDL